MSMVPTLRFPEFHDEWQRKNLAELVKVRGGYAFKSEKFSNEGIPVVRISNLIADTGYVDVTSAVRHQEISKDENYIVRKGDILIALSGATTGKSCIYDHDFDGYLNQRVGKFELVSDSADYGFLRKVIFSSKFKGQMDCVLVAGAQPNIAPKDIEKFSFSFPLLPEQQKIASFLSSVDKKIDLLRQKKKELELYKKGLIQKIFSQEIRFKESDGSDFSDWEDVALEDVFSSSKGSGLSKDSISDSGQNACVLYGELYTKYEEEIETVLSKTKVSDGVRSSGDDILIPSSTTTSAIDLVNFTALRIPDVLLGGDITILHPKLDLNIKFFAYYLTHAKRYELASRGQGSTIVHLYFQHIKKIRISVPSLEEQNMIVSILDALTLRSRKVSSCIEQMETFKKGLLQQMFV